MRRSIPILTILALTACAGLSEPRMDAAGAPPIREAKDDSRGIKLRVKAEVRLAEFTQEVEFGMLNATQGNFVRTFSEEGFNVIINLLPVVDPERPSIIDSQYQVEIGERAAEGGGKPRPDVVQVQNEFLFELGKPQTVLEAEDAKVTLTFWKVE
ncbi:MAG: hypothetical protein WC728_02955 [Elusimicrobiota bacterium]